MQNLGEIPNLHGVEEDPTISEEIDIRVRGYRAFRWAFYFNTFRIYKNSF